MYLYAQRIAISENQLMEVAMDVVYNKKGSAQGVVVLGIRIVVQVVAVAVSKGSKLSSFSSTSSSYRHSTSTSVSTSS